jgi:hypothetical protein
MTTTHQTCFSSTAVGIMHTHTTTLHYILKLGLFDPYSSYILDLDLDLVLPLALSLLRVKITQTTAHHLIS